MQLHREAFLHHLRSSGLADASIKRYFSFASRWMQHLEAEEVSPKLAQREHVAAFLHALRAAGAKPATLRLYQRSIRIYHAFLAEQGEGSLPGDPVRVRADQLLPKALTRDEALALLEAADGQHPLEQRDRAALELAYSSGLRASELCGLTLEHLDLDNLTARIFGKGRREDVVSFGEEAAAALRRYLGLGRPRLLRTDSPRVFLNNRGGPLTACGFWRMVERTARKAGLSRHVHPHMLRHSFATHLMDAGANLRVIQELMRHRSLNSTAIYTRLDSRRLADERRKYHPRK